MYDGTGMEKWFDIRHDKMAYSWSKQCIMKTQVDEGRVDGICKFTQVSNIL